MKKALCILLALCLLTASVNVFAADTYHVGGYDIPYDEGGAQRLARLGLFYGTENGYALDEGVTRAQAAVMVLRLIGEEQNVAADAQSRFADMEGHWARDAVAYADALGYINGTGEDTFEPERGVTGREFVKILLSAMGYTDITIENAYDKGVETALLVNNFTKAAVRDADYALNRNDMVSICSSALLTKTPDGRMLKDVLVEKGTFTIQEFNSVMLCVLPVPPQARGFGWNLNMYMPQDKNYMFSPLSIKIALAMAANGAEGETRQEMLDALGIDDLDAFNTHVAELIARYAENEDVKLEISNSIWLNKEYPGAQNAKFQDGFVRLLTDYYAAEADTVTNADAAQRINGWIEQKTNGKIKNVIQDADFLSALVNAVYFKGTWREQFKTNATAPDTFTSRDGSEKELDFMNQTGYFRYYEDDMVQMVRLPYEDRDIAMYIAMPSARAVDLDRYVEKMDTEYVKLSIPKFKIEYEEKLNDMLGELGMKQAFSDQNTEFTKMIDNYPLNIFIDKVIHKTYIDVDENGTEAAAVTAVINAAGSAMPPEPVSFVADKPFTYFIYDEANGEILFMGEYAFAE